MRIDKRFLFLLIFFFFFFLKRYQNNQSQHAVPHGNNPASSRSRGDRSSRPTASQGGPRPGYGEGRGHYHAPKGIIIDFTS